MNKNIKVKQLFHVLPASQKILFCECDANGDTVKLTNSIHVGDNNMYTTYMERHICYIEVSCGLMYIFI